MQSDKDALLLSLFKERSLVQTLDTVARPCCRLSCRIGVRRAAPPLQTV